MTVVKLNPSVAQSMGFKYKEISTETQPSTVGPEDLIIETRDGRKNETLENQRIDNQKQRTKEPGEKSFADIGW